MCEMIVADLKGTFCFFLLRSGCKMVHSIIMICATDFFTNKRGISPKLGLNVFVCVCVWGSEYLLTEERPYTCV